MAIPHDPAPIYYNLNVRIPADLIARLRAVASRERNGVSAVARRILADALDDAAPKSTREASRG